MRKLLVIFYLLSLSAFAQFGSNTARRVVSGTAAPPASCSAGPVDIYVRTGATLPDFYLCLTANTWTGPLAGGGSGTVSANNGSAGAVANYAAAGGSTTVGPDATLLDNGTNLIYTGTTGIRVPDGAAATPSIAFNGATTSGFHR